VKLHRVTAQTATAIAAVPVTIPTCKSLRHAKSFQFLKISRRAVRHARQIRVCFTRGEKLRASQLSAKARDVRPMEPNETISLLPSKLT